MGWAQILVIIWLSVITIAGLIAHGTPQKGYYNFAHTLIGVLIWLLLLGAGNFWTAG